MKKVWWILIVVVLVVVAGYFVIGNYLQYKEESFEADLILEWKDSIIGLGSCFKNCEFDEIVLDYEKGLRAVDGDSLRERYGDAAVVYELNRECIEGCVSHAQEIFPSEEPSDRQHYSDSASLFACFTYPALEKAIILDCLDNVILNINS